MSNYKELDETLSLVKKFATIEQIKDVLRTRKGEENVRITANTIDELVNSNLRTAVEKRAIEIDKVFDLIRDAEENGNQHIFYYKVNSTAIAEAISFEKLAPRMWGPGWKKKLEDDFPAIKLKPNDFKFSDFRQLPKKPRDWVLKIYGQATVERYTGDLKHQGKFFWRKYVKEELRSVLLARWNSPDLLEIRVDRNDSRRRVEGWHNKVWDMLKPHVVRSQFKPWELPAGMKNLITKQVGNEEIYTFRDAKVIDKTRIHVSFQTEADTERSLFSSDETRESLQSYLDAKSDCDGLTVSWKFFKPDKTLEKELKTLLGVGQSQGMRSALGNKGSNEMVVQAHCRAEDLEYVTSQLRQFNK